MLLVINPGSSSVKATVYDESDIARSVYSVSIEGIGTGKATLLPESVFNEDTIEKVTAPDFSSAVQLVQKNINTKLGGVGVEAIGYRVVHGGDRYKAPARIDSQMIEYLRLISSLAPNHMHGAIECIEAFRSLYRGSFHIACFDTSFFSEIPALARTLPIPKSLTEQGVRRYGFHGLSYEYLLNSFKEIEGDQAARGRVIMAHMGNGVSLTALKDGRPVDMTMGFTPVSGVPMGTRTGDIEPGVILHLLRDKKMSLDEVTDVVTKQSGLLGVSDDTADMYHLLQHQDSNPSAAFTVGYFCYEIRKQIGAYAAVLGGVDSIIFAGGIGERSAEIRARILEGLGFIGVIIDPEQNEQNARLISGEGSTVGVHVIPTHEDLIIAKHTKEIYEGDNR